MQNVVTDIRHTGGMVFTYPVTTCLLEKQCYGVEEDSERRVQEVKRWNFVQRTGLFARLPLCRCKREVESKGRREKKSKFKLNRGHFTKARPRTGNSSDLESPPQRYNQPSHKC